MNTANFTNRASDERAVVVAVVPSSEPLPPRPPPRPGTTLHRRDLAGSALTGPIPSPTGPSPTTDATRPPPAAASGQAGRSGVARL